MDRHPHTPVPKPSSPSRLRSIVGWLFGLGALSLALGAAAVVVAWFPVFVRIVGGETIESFLRVLLVVYAGVLLGSLVGIVVAVSALAGGRRRSGRRRWGFPLLAVAAAALVALGVAELGAAGWLWWRDRLPTLPSRFEPPDGRAHLLVLGESSALGHPYNPTLSVGQIVAWQLDERLPERRFQVDVLAKLGATLADMTTRLASVKQRPEAVVVFAGHNEFTSYFGEQRAVDFDEAPEQPVMHGLYRLSLQSPLCRLIYRTVYKFRHGVGLRAKRMRRLCDVPMCTPLEAAQRLADFERRMEAIVAWSDRVGALPILIIPPGNEAGYEPNRSVVPPSRTAMERAQLASDYWEARQWESDSNPERALDAFRLLVEREPGLAEGHFRLARLLEQAGAWAEARSHYLAARDLDAMPSRMTSPFEEVYRRVAARHPACILIDGPAELRAVCPHAIVDDHAMQDGQHPSLRGMAALGRAVVRALEARRAFGLGGSVDVVIEPRSCVARYGVDAKRWSSVCDWGRSFYRWTADFRFDPRERDAKARRFEELRDAFDADQPVFPTNFPPLSLEPLPVADQGA
jgi:hypothetical protein